MAFSSIGTLADGQLTGSETVLYSSSTQSASVNIRLAATDTGAYGVTLYVRRSGSVTSRRLTGFSYALPAGGHDIYPPDGSIKLGPGDELRGYASTTLKVDYVVEGATTTGTA